MDRLRDNFDFFDAYDKQQAAWEAKLPVCDCCGCHMAEWYEVRYKLSTWQFCTDCCKHEYWED